MTIVAKYYSDMDQETMFDTKAEAENHELKITCASRLTDLVKGCAQETGINLSDDEAKTLSARLLEKHASELIDIASGKKPRKPRSNGVKNKKDRSSTTEDGSNNGGHAQQEAA